MKAFTNLLEVSDSLRFPKILQLRGMSNNLQTYRISLFKGIREDGKPGSLQGAWFIIRDL